MTEMNEELSRALTANYLIASVSVRIWSAKRTDQEASDNLTASKGASANSAKVIKSLMQGNDTELNDAKSAYMRLRTYFYANTVPWGEGRSDGLIGVGDSLQFIAEFGRLKTEAEVARDALVKVFEMSRPGLLASLQRELGGLFKAEDYPDGAEIRSMFGASMQLRPMPDVADFSRINIPAPLVKGLQGVYARQASASVEAAVEDVRNRLMKAVERVHTQLSKVANEEKTRLYGTMLSNLDLLCGMASGLSPLSAELAELAKRIKSELLTHEIDALKGNSGLARSIAEKAGAILGPSPSQVAWNASCDAAIAGVPAIEIEEPELELPDIESLL